MRVSKNALNSYHFGEFFRSGRDAVSMFFESPENRGKDTLLYQALIQKFIWGARVAEGEGECVRKARVQNLTMHVH